MDLSEGIGRKQQESVIFEGRFDHHLLLLGEACLYFSELVTKLRSHFREVDFIGVQVVAHIIVGDGGFRISPQKVKILSGKVPRRAVVPHISAVIEDEVVLFLGRKYLF